MGKMMWKNCCRRSNMKFSFGHLQDYMKSLHTYFVALILTIQGSFEGFSMNMKQIEHNLWWWVACLIRAIWTWLSEAVNMATGLAMQLWHHLEKKSQLFKFLFVGFSKSMKWIGLLFFVMSCMIDQSQHEHDALMWLIFPQIGEATVTPVDEICWRRVRQQWHLMGICMVGDVGNVALRKEVMVEIRD